MSTSVDEMNFLNLQFMQALKKFDYTNIEGIIALQEMDPAEFVLTIQETIKYHVSRLNKQYEKMQEDIEKNMEEDTLLISRGCVRSLPRHLKKKKVKK